MFEYKKLSANVIQHKETLNYLTRIHGAASLRDVFAEEELHEITVTDTKIETRDNTYTTGVVVTISKETKNKDFLFIELVISDILGTFVSEWY